MYVIIIEDSHDDVRIKLYRDKEIAIDKARHIAKTQFHYSEKDYKERNYGGYLFYATYTSEGDCVSVKEIRVSD